MDGVKDVSAIVAHAAGITDANRYSFQNDEALFMLESFLSDFLWTNSSIAVLAHLTVSRFLSGLC